MWRFRVSQVVPILTSNATSNWCNGYALHRCLCK